MESHHYVLAEMPNARVPVSKVLLKDQSDTQILVIIALVDFTRLVPTVSISVRPP
jgi:hypothetical protein